MKYDESHFNSHCMRQGLGWRVWLTRLCIGRAYLDYQVWLVRLYWWNPVAVFLAMVVFVVGSLVYGIPTAWKDVIVLGFAKGPDKEAGVYGPFFGFKDSHIERKVLEMIQAKAEDYEGQLATWQPSNERFEVEGMSWRRADGYRQVLFHKRLIRFVGQDKSFREDNVSGHWIILTSTALKILGE